MKIITKEKKEIAEEWIKKHGAASFDFKNKNIILYDGGIFWLEEVKYKAHKIVGRKKLDNGCVEIIFSKKPILNSIRHDAYIWFEELDKTIAYFKSMRRMLRKIGYKTNMKN